MFSFFKKKEEKQHVTIKSESLNSGSENNSNQKREKRIIIIIIRRRRRKQRPTATNKIRKQRIKKKEETTQQNNKTALMANPPNIRPPSSMAGSQSSEPLASLEPLATGPRGRDEPPEQTPRTCCGQLGSRRGPGSRAFCFGKFFGSAGFLAFPRKNLGSEDRTSGGNEKEHHNLSLCFGELFEWLRQCSCDTLVSFGLELHGGCWGGDSFCQSGWSPPTGCHWPPPTQWAGSQLGFSQKLGSQFCGPTCFLRFGDLQDSELVFVSPHSVFARRLGKWI